jgi:hypothetical protein
LKISSRRIYEDSSRRDLREEMYEAEKWREMAQNYVHKQTSLL